MSISSSGSRGAAGNKIPKGYAAGKLQQFTPEQQNLFQSLFSHVSPGSQLSQQAQGSDEGFAPYEDYANRQFQEFSGQNASRFSGGNIPGAQAGAMSARRGSGFQNQQTQGAQDFASQLAMQRQGLQRQALQDLMGISGQILGQSPQENFLIRKPQKPPSFASRLFGAAAPLAGAGIGAAFGGLPGASFGAQLGGGIASGFQPTQW